MATTKSIVVLFGSVRFEWEIVAVVVMGPHATRLLHSNIGTFHLQFKSWSLLREQLKGEDLYLCYKGGSSLELVFS